MNKTATTSFSIHALLAERWSPRAFADRPVEGDKLGSLFEAARWAASCFNDQPWRFFVATREDPVGFERLASCLMDGNAWAKEAPVLIVTAARTTFERNDKPNRHAWHDVGLAVGNLCAQAEALGLSLHQMAGFDAARAAEVLELPAAHEAVTMIALGYRAGPEGLPEALREREEQPRERKPLGEIAFGPGWGQSLGAIS